MLGGHWLALAGALDRCKLDGAGDADTALAAVRSSLRFAHTLPAAAALCSLLERAKVASQAAVVEAVTTSVLAWRAAEAGDPIPALPPSALALLATAARRGTDLPAAAAGVQRALEGERGLPEGTASALAKAMNAAVACVGDERAALRRIAGHYAAAGGEEPVPEAAGEQGGRDVSAAARGGMPKAREEGEEEEVADEDRGGVVESASAAAGAGAGEADGGGSGPAGEEGREEEEEEEGAGDDAQDGGGQGGSWWRLW